MNQINYAKIYSDALAQAFPSELHFGALYANESTGRYRFTGGKSIEIPVITVSGRTDANRDTVEDASRNYENMWESKYLSHQRKWSTLIHPQDIDQTDYATTIANITSVFNHEHKFPEMDAYTVSKIYTDWAMRGKTAVRETLTAENVLDVFDTLMANMTEANVPVTGRILYVTPAVMKLLKSSAAISRSFDVKASGGEIHRTVTMLDGVSVVEVPSFLMQTNFDFTSGVKSHEMAQSIQMFLIHPEAVITPVSYEFACLDEPSASTGGKYVYYEESFEDVFLLNRRADGVAFVLNA